MPESDTRTDRLRQQARNLEEEPPRSPDQQIGGFSRAARVLDKCRASLLGIQGEYQFGCPFDQAFFHDHGISQDDFKDIVATGASDEEIGDWLRKNAQPQVH